MLLHHGPVTLSQTQDRTNPSVASRTKNRVPPDAQKSAPTLTLAHFGGTSMHSLGGHVVIDPVDPTNAVESLTVNIPTTFNHYVTANYPVNFNDDVRHVGDLIDKYGRPSYGSTIRRMRLLEDMPSGPGAHAQAIGLDPNGNPVGVPFTVWDLAGPDDTGSGSACNSCPPCPPTPKKNDIGYAMYFSDRAPTVTLKDKNNVPTTYAGALADVAVRPNTGAYELIALVPGSPTRFCPSITVVVRICCLNGALVVCTQDFTFCSCAPLSIVAGVIDCGGSACT